MLSSEAQRTLVKSPPELWAELSDPNSLARHLEEFGEIRILRTEPESAVEWEGEGVAGAVQLNASGWGTKVTLTATRQPPAALALRASLVDRSDARMCAAGAKKHPVPRHRRISGRLEQ